MSVNERNPGHDISSSSRHETVDWAVFFSLIKSTWSFLNLAHFLLTVINRLFENSKVASVFDIYN